MKWQSKEKYISKKRERNPWEGEGMFPVSKDEVIQILPRKEQKNFKLPKGFEKIDWSRTPFLFWKHPSGHKAYLLEQRLGETNINIFDVDTKSRGRKKASMCNLCFHVHSSSSGVSIFMFTAKSNPNKRLGFYFCSNVDCVKNATKTSVNAMRETLSPREKRTRMLEKLDDLLMILETS